MTSLILISHLLFGVIKPRLQVRFFACSSDAIFLRIVASSAHGKNLTCSRLLAVPFQSVKGASESRKQARGDWSERTSRGETWGEAREKGTALSFVTDAFEFPAASGTEKSDWFIDSRKLSRNFDEY